MFGHAAVLLSAALLTGPGHSSASKPRPVGQRVRSIYEQIAVDTAVESPKTLLRAVVNLSRADTLFVQSDGTYRPHGASAANVFIAVDGQKASNDSLVDWRTSQEKDAHPFDAVGSAALGRGTHTIELRAEPPSLPLCFVTGIEAGATSVSEDCRPNGGPSSAGSFDVLAGANLSVLVHPAEHVVSQRLAADAGPFNFDTAGYLTVDNLLTRPLPLTPLLSSTVAPHKRAIALGSGWLYPTARTSDAMLALLIDGRFPGDDTSSWGNQDLWYGAELRAPVSVHEFVRASGKRQDVALGTTEFPWAPDWVPGMPDNPVVYSVAAGTTMTLLTGGFSVAGVAGGSASISPNPEPVTVGSSLYGPPTGTDVALASGYIEVPRGSPGVVFFSAKALTQGGDGPDTGWTSHGTISLSITIDGKSVGPHVVQQVSAPGDSGSGRTIATSYLAAGKDRLKAGQHQVVVRGRADGSFFRAWMWPNAALIWFD